MAVRIYHNHKLKEVNSFKELLNDLVFDDLLKILYASFDKLEIDLKKHLQSLKEFEQLKVCPRRFYFQDKFRTPDFEILHFQNGLDQEIYALGIPERILALIKPIFNKEELLRLSGQWLKQGYKPFLVGSLDFSQKLGSIHPSHFENKMYLESLLGFSNG